MQRPSPYSSTSMKKITTLIRNLILSHVTRVLSKSKSILIEAMEELRHLNNINILAPLIYKKNRNKNNKLYLGSFRLHYHWSCSSHIKVPKSSIHDGFNGYVYYYDSKKVTPESHLSGYLDWLDGHEKNVDIDTNNHDINEIDDLADKFIANCRGKFILEKQDSDRKFQEMMARSV